MEFLNDDLIYYEDESGKKDNVGLFVKENETTCSIYNGENYLDLPKNKIYPIEIDDKIMSGIRDLEKIDRWHYKCKGELANFLFVIELPDAKPWYILDIYVYDEEHIKTPKYYDFDGLLSNCLRFTSIRYLHELQHLEHLLCLEICLYDVNGKVFGIDSCKDASGITHLVSCHLTDRNLLEEYKEKVKNEKTKRKENI